MKDPGTYEGYDRPSPDSSSKEYCYCINYASKHPGRMVRHKPGVTDCSFEETGLRLREGDQPLPIPNSKPIIHELVIEDVKARLEIGTKRYGTGLQPYNGRNALRDAYEEVLDLAAYLRQKIWEEENPNV